MQRLPSGLLLQTYTMLSFFARFIWFVRFRNADLVYGEGVHVGALLRFALAVELPHFLFVALLRTTIFSCKTKHEVENAL